MITKEDAVHYVGVIHEAALRMQLGGRDIARRQLRHLLDSSERTNVTLRVISFTAGGFALLDTSLLYAEASNPHLDTVHTDAPTGAVFIDSPTRLANFCTRLDLAEQVALTSSE
ncbi:Scr1 family TA system antitoxin-like transcriptional regulator [Streptomyces sp. NPDC059396]|uniref:Scr1 family TA system antitoxin-like transcriptional regulator n=1 Tax=Streptomyces sp. NPDC059396 TaxID=3346819 RepID=UPI003678C334